MWRPRFETWLNNTTARKLNCDDICVIAHNSFQMDWLQSHYTDAILKTLEEVTGERFNLEYHAEKDWEV